MLKLRPFALLTVATLTLAACAGTAAPPSQSFGALATPRPTPTAVPGDPGNGGSGGGGGGSDPGNGTGGGVFIPGPGGADPNANPLIGNATYVKPTRGLVNQRTVNVQLVRAVVNADGTATADLRWWSGVAPCSALDHVEMITDEAARTIHLKVIEGSAAVDVACIDIAQLSATAVDLGKLASGTWMISVEGDASPIPLEVP
ncbi:MAG: hypothetical protein ABI620_06245 [Chloroflexota bacterium]